MTFNNCLSKTTLLVGALLLALPNPGQPQPSVESGAIFQDYVAQQGLKDTVVAQVERESGREGERGRPKRL